MLNELMDDNKTVIKAMRAAHEVADKHDDVATASILENFIDQAENATGSCSRPAAPPTVKAEGTSKNIDRPSPLGRLALGCHPLQRREGVRCRLGRLCGPAPLGSGESPLLGLIFFFLTCPAWQTSPDCSTRMLLFHSRRPCNRRCARSKHSR